MRSFSIGSQAFEGHVATVLINSFITSRMNTEKVHN